MANFKYLNKNDQNLIFFTWKYFVNDYALSRKNPMTVRAEKTKSNAPSNVSNSQSLSTSENFQ